MTFGFLFDIDGVFLKGKNVLPQAVKALKLLKDKNNNWRIPVVFVTNAGNSLKKVKAERLSNQLEINVIPEQVVMAHSPFSMLEHFHKKYSLVCGQGPIKEIAHNLGFKDVITIDEYKNLFPHLDVCNHKRPKAAPCAFEKFQRRLESIILFGESVNWETPLQIIIDLLLSNGHPYRVSEIKASEVEFKRSYSLNYPHIPVLACNMDLIWMSDAPSPRFAHGTFLHALEALYKKYSGNRLLYTALVGKPSELTYHHAISKLNYISNLMIGGKRTLKRVYCIGYLKSRKSSEMNALAKKIINNSPDFSHEFSKSSFRKRSLISNSHTSSSIYQLASAIENNIDNESDNEDSLQALESILVLTGVYNDEVSIHKPHLPRVLQTVSTFNHNHRDFPDHSELKIPNYLAKDIFEAVKYTFDKEKFPYELLS